MKTQFIIAIWVLIGGFSFSATQSLIKGWSYVRSQPHPIKTVISACLMGPITTLTCFYTIFKYYKTRRKN